MKMVAGARLNRAQQRITALRPYAVKTQEVLAGVAAAMIDEADRPRVQRQDTPTGSTRCSRGAPEKNVLFLVLSGDRGLCGAFNTNINKAAERALARASRRPAPRSQFATVGRKGREYLARRDGADRARLPARLRRARPRRRRGCVARVARRSASRSGEVDAIYLVYNEFKSAMTQQVVVERAPAARRSRRSARKARLAADRVHLRAEQARAARAPRADVRRDLDLPRAPREPGERASARA